MVAHSGSLEERNKERNKESEEWKREKERPGYEAKIFREKLQSSKSLMHVRLMK